MVEVNDMDTMEEHFHPMNYRPDVEGMNTIEEHFLPMNHRSKVEGMNIVDTDMGEDRVTELEVVEREPEGVVLVRHWSGDASSNSSGVGGAFKTRVFKRSTYIYNLGLQL
jgi:hypothetical protein